MSSLEPRLAEILEGIVDQYAAPSPDDRYPLLHTTSSAGGRIHGWAAHLPRVQRHDLDDLQSYDLIDIDYGGSDGNTYQVRPTGRGRKAIYAARREQRRDERAEPVDLSWPAVRPVLHAATDLWAEAGASGAEFMPLGLIADRLGREPDSLQLIRAVEHLGIDDWLDVDYNDESDEPFLRPTQRAVTATRAWPGGDSEVAAERLLAVLDDIAANAPDEGKRKWAARLRDTAMEVTSKTLAEVASKMAGDAI